MLWLVVTRRVHQYFSAEADFTCPLMLVGWDSTKSAFVRGALNRIDGEQFSHPLAPDSLRRRPRGSVRPSLKLRQRDRVHHGRLPHFDLQARTDSGNFLGQPAFRKALTANTPASNSDSAVTISTRPILRHDRGGQPVVVDGNMIMSRLPADLGLFCRPIIGALGD